MGADSQVAGKCLLSAEESFSALLADVSESDDPEMVADRADPDLFFCSVRTGAARRIPAAVPAGTSGASVTHSVRDGGFDPVFVRFAVPVSFFCTVYLHFGGRNSGFSEKDGKKPIK